MHFAVGLISDTHGVFDKAAAEQLKNTGLVIHAGDVGHHGRHREVLELYADAVGAPALAVAGNVDDKLDAEDRQLLPQHRLVHVAGWKLLVCHIVASGPTAKVDAAAAALIQQLQPDIVVCGHSHKACCWQAGGVCYINAGSAGPARFKLPRTVALLELPPKTSAADTSRHPGPPVNAADRECVPATAAATSRSSRDQGGERTARVLRSRASKGCTAMAEQCKAACSSACGNQGSSDTAAAAAAAAAAGERNGGGAGESDTGSVSTDASLVSVGDLHVRFVQLPQKAPRLAACK